jgi:uncharacterized repeat protein (TIGR03803 family)
LDQIAVKGAHAKIHHAVVTEHVVYSFTGNPDASMPGQGALVNVNGTLYGTTQRGGTNLGTVYNITTSGVESVLHGFLGQPTDGFNPVAGLDKSAHYGTTEYGGLYNFGTVFKLLTTGKVKVLHSFAGVGIPADGEGPEGNLVNLNGTLYGTTFAGGASNLGTVFSITPSGTYNVLYSFSGLDGAYPQSGLIVVNGNLYGTTKAGGTGSAGTVFGITTSGFEHVYHSFAGAPKDGRAPIAGLVNLNGTLYGTTLNGGTSNNGTVFRVKISDETERVVHSFAGGTADGANPSCALINVSGTLYGTTSQGGASGNGTVFSFKSGTESLLYSFAGEPDGANPYAGLTNVSGVLYGTTNLGGTGSNGGNGTVYSIVP